MDENNTLAAIFPATVVTLPHDNPTINPNDKNQKAVGIPLAVVHKDAQLVDLKPYFDKYRTRPEVRKGNVLLTQPASFVQFINRYKSTESTVIFVKMMADQEQRLVCIFNYHPISPDISATGAGDFRAELVGFEINSELIGPIVRETGLQIFYGDIP